MFKSRALLSVVSLAAALVAPQVTRAQSAGIAWRTNLDAAKIEAIQSNRLLLVHFWKPTCGPCRVLDQTVFSQPQVGAVVERTYVPVKVDTDASPALAGYFRIEQVPTDVVLDSQGNVVATLPCPMAPDAYLGQLENLARNYSQTTAKPAGADAASVNAAYANLPVSRAMPANLAAATAGDRYAQQSAGPQPQSNPYFAGRPVPGQARAVYPTQTASMTPGMTPPGLPQAATTSPAAAPITASLPTMPATAMPRSYQASLTANQAAAAPAQTQITAAQPAPPAAVQAGVGPAASPYPVTQPAASPPTASPQTVQLPAGCPPLAFDGCCPVTLKTYKKWATGNVAYGAVHRGRTYLFVGSKERDQFLANPDAYAPVFSGLDPVLLLDSQKSTPGSRKFGYEFDGRFYLFSSRETMERFASSASAYAAGVRQAMNKIDGAAGGTVRR